MNSGGLSLDGSLKHCTHSGELMLQTKRPRWTELKGRRLYWKAVVDCMVDREGLPVCLDFVYSSDRTSYIGLRLHICLRLHIRSTRRQSTAWSLKYKAMKLHLTR